MATIPNSPNPGEFSRVEPRRDTPFSPSAVKSTDRQVSAKEIGKLCGRSYRTMQLYAKQGLLTHCFQDSENHNKWVFWKEATLQQLKDLEETYARQRAILPKFRPGRSS